MKKILFILILILTSCAGGSGSYDRTPNQVKADTYNYSIHKGKTVKLISYCDGCGYSGDLLTIYFTDNTSLTIYAYKYVMKIEYAVNKIDADAINYDVYKGKIVKSISYCDGCGNSGDWIVIDFMDGADLTIYAYKYTMEIIL